jgi:hypothetical protein
MKKILASILAVVLLGTMAISGFAAETVEDEPIVSGTAQEATNASGSRAQVTSDGHAVVTVSEEDAEDGSVDVPVILWNGCDITAVLPEGVDEIDLVIPFTPATEKLGWGIVGFFADPETDDEIVLDNTFDEDDHIVLFDVPADTTVTLEDRAVKFDDVPADAWFAKYFDYASAHEYVVGNGDGTVEPEAPIAAEALYAVLLRLKGEGEGTTGDNWAENAKAAAVEAGFATDAEGELTREEAIEIVSAFIGEDAVEAGIFIGDENADLDLEGDFIRAHLAVISMRLVEFLNGYSK